ncbi:MAG: 7,8-didemethyl-8-hydroxy-5-deazariboflavin synthase subunit CofG [Synechococcaceae cyanobacterium]
MASLSGHATGPRVITWSPSVTLVPARGCFNACGYCGFRLPPNPADPFAGGIDPPAAASLLSQRPDALEVLLLSGEVAPESPERPRWFGRLRQLCQLALSRDRLPHTNAGPLSRREMASLARLNGSMGLMLEGLGPAYDALHQQAPSKRLARRLEQLELAGRLGIPFTTGLLLGLGETVAARHDALELLAHLQARWGHIQEVILQPWRPAQPQPQALGAAALETLLETIAAARALLPAEVHLQLPANLWPVEALPRALEAGIDDLGGIDLHDVINPSYPQPRIGELAATLATAGFQLRPRLCVHRAWFGFLPPPLRQRAIALEARLLASGLADPPPEP